MQEHVANYNVIVVTFLAASFIIALFAPSSFIIKSKQSIVSDRSNIIQEANFDDLKPSYGFLYGRLCKDCSPGFPFGLQVLYGRKGKSLGGSVSGQF